jgi:lipopolysaccharide/colanic/teichoic acid biosynthesis glycosyltransferase
MDMEINQTLYSWIKDLHPKDALFKGQSYLIIKRLMDLFITILSLPVWLPLIGLLALLVRIESPGSPAIFTQLRTGKNGKRFQMYKLRSMVPNAEQLKKKLAHLNELQWPDFKITNDPRITRIGRFLRKTSLDELPQMINVLKNEMSLVGPRPTSFSADTYQLWQTERLDVMPGITGLWQIYGRGETEFSQRLKMDIAYIDRRCLSLDIQILFRTLIAVLKRRGAK